MCVPSAKNIYFFAKSHRCVIVCVSHFRYLCIQDNSQKLTPLDMSDYYIFLDLEPYLGQWLINSLGGKQPARFPKGSPENDLLFYFLQKQPEGCMPQLQPAKPTEVAIAIPYFKDKDPRIYNYITPRAKLLLKNCIRNKFAIELWRECSQFKKVCNMSKQEAVYAFMVSHGIEETDTNWCAIDKAFQRKRQAVRALNWYKNQQKKEIDPEK